MPASDATARFDLPLLMAGQAQKEITHNEALAMIDALLCPIVEAVGVNQPVAQALPGQAWITGGAPSGEWTGRSHALAFATVGGWRIADMPEGSDVFDRATGGLWRRHAGGWHAPAAIAGANGGSVIDQQCRAALSSLISALAARGIISSA